MDGTIALMLLQDGLTTGTVYASIGIALVLVFSLTRVLMMFVGEFVSFGALTFVALQNDVVPGVVWLLLLLGPAAGVARIVRRRGRRTAGFLATTLAVTVAAPIAVVSLAIHAAPLRLPMGADVALTFALVVPLANYIYVLVYEPLEDASILTLLISAVGVHLALIGLGLFFFGPEGLRSPSLVPGTVSIAGLRFTWQAIVIYAATAATLLGLFLFFTRTLFGTALRAVAVNRTGARLVGIPTALSGHVAFGLAAAVATSCGLLVGPTTTIFYDTGFVIALKGFVAAVLGALASFPLVAVAALGIGVVEAFSAFLASSYKEAIVFSLILPTLLVRSMLAGHVGDDGE